MSSDEYYRLALQQQVLYYQNLQEVLEVEAEIEDLKAKIAAKHKKHRRCDKEIQKEFKVTFLIFSVLSVRRCMHLISLSSCTSN